MKRRALAAKKPEFHRRFGEKYYEFEISDTAIFISSCHVGTPCPPGSYRGIPQTKRRPAIMHIRSALSIAVIVAATAAASPALAATAATATTPLNIRGGPGPQYPIIGVLPDNGRAIVTGCIQGSLWCQISFNGRPGWAYSRYLAMDRGGQTVIVAEQPSIVPTVTYQGPATTVETVGSAPPPVAGTLIDTTDTEPMVITRPPAPVGTYVEANPVNPVYLSGEVVVGAGLPASVALTPVPNSQYEYAYVNSVPVLVEPNSRRIVYIYR